MFWTGQLAMAWKSFQLSRTKYPFRLSITESQTFSLNYNVYSMEIILGYGKFMRNWTICPFSVLIYWTSKHIIAQCLA